MPARANRRVAEAGAQRHEQARISAGNAGDNWTIQWPAKDVKAEVKPLKYWEKQSEPWPDRRAPLSRAQASPAGALEVAPESGNVAWHL